MSMQLRPCQPRNRSHYTGSPGFYEAEVVFLRVANTGPTDLVASIFLDFPFTASGRRRRSALWV